MSTLLPEARLARAARPLLHRCAGWHASAASCPCALDRDVDDRAADASAGGPVPGSAREVLSQAGRPLADADRVRLQQRLGHDFAHVRVHEDTAAAASARSLSALAYTAGEHVVLDRSRLPAAPSERDTVLAHELVHTLQHGRLAQTGMPPRVSRPDDTTEREASRVAGDRARPRRSTGIPAVRGNALHREPPGDRPAWGIRLQVREDGRLDVTAGGLAMPVVGAPELGIRRRPDGGYTFLVGGQGHVVAAGEVPDPLRGMLHAGPASSPQARTFRVPSCAQLRTADGTRWQTHDEYRTGATLLPDVLPLSRTLYDAVLGQCRAAGGAAVATTAPATVAARAPAPTLPSLPEGQVDA